MPNPPPASFGPRARVPSRARHVVGREGGEGWRKGGPGKPLDAFAQKLARAISDANVFNVRAGATRVSGCGSPSRPDSHSGALTVQPWPRPVTEQSGRETRGLRARPGRAWAPRNILISASSSSSPSSSICVVKSSGFGLYVTVKHRRKNGSGVREPVQCGIRKIHAVNVKLHEPSNSVEWPQLLKHLKKRPSGTRHDFVLVSSKSARLRWSLGQPLKLRTRLFTAGLLEEGVAAFSDFLLVLLSPLHFVF